MKKGKLDMVDSVMVVLFIVLIIWLLVRVFGGG